jgi:riboflavin biosynthesis pyrimidine reductase
LLSETVNCKSYKHSRVRSTVLVQTLIERDLVDEFRLVIDPLVVGGGKRIFRNDGVLRTLRLVDSAR